MTAAVSREHIVAEIRRTAIGGRALGRALFAEATGIREGDWLGRYWVKWGDALQEAGFEPNAMQGRYNDDFIFSKLVEEVRRLRRMPTHAELKLRRREEPDFPSGSVFGKFGRKRELAAKLAAYCREQGDCEDVLEALSPLLGGEPPADSGDDGVEAECGFVYLLKMGRRYKIGHTNAVGRRQYDLGIKLPDSLALIHEIRTDDPEGIERYWHRRFADKRRAPDGVKTEWFDLRAEDVRAFKRRKFM